MIFVSALTEVLLFHCRFKLSYLSMYVQSLYDLVSCSRLCDLQTVGGGSLVQLDIDCPHFYSLRL